MTGFNVNCTDCGWCESYPSPIDELDLIYICTAFFPTCYEVDVINNRDCVRFRSKKHPTIDG